MTVAPPLQSPLNQVALSVIDLKRSEQWFREGLGFVLELFQFCRPVAQLMPDDARPCDTGYRRIGAWVADFDAALSRLAALGTRPLSVVMGERGERRVCVRNPDGVFVEIMEKDPLPQTPGRERAGCDVALRSVTLATPDLAASVATLRVLSAKEASLLVLHDPALQQRPQPDNQRVEASVPIDAVWAVLNEQGRMGDWIGFPQVSVRREGFAQRNGRGSERFMKEPLGTVREQVTGVEAKSRIRYRVIDGSPVVYQQGEIGVAASGRGTRATWSIRFRCKVPLLGGLLLATLRRVLASMLIKGLKAHVEGAGRPALQTA